MIICLRSIGLLAFSVLAHQAMDGCCARAQELPSQIQVIPGAVNSVVIENGGKHVVIYGADLHSADDCQAVLLTHHRRDVVWRANQLIEAGVATYGPIAELPLFENVDDYWRRLTSARFHDYQCQSTKVLTQAIKITPVSSGEVLDFRSTAARPSLRFEVVDTPGFTAGSVSYLLELEGKRIAFVGDLIYGDGQLIDLYSLQDSVESAAIRGYHGYAARLSSLVTSLKKIKTLQPNLLIPARGPVISDVDAAIDKLIARVQAVYLNYLSTGALHWYFKEERMRLCAQAVMGGPAENLKLMPFAVHQQSPDWIFESATSRLLLSDSGAGFLIDCGYQRVIDAVQQQIDSGIIDKVEGIFVTHYHDDHTDKVQAASERFQCPVYCLQDYQDILAHPHAYRMPAMTDQPINNLRAVPDKHQLKWHEFQFTFHFFPGQALYHGALLVERPTEQPVFFIGDSFAPSGIDDYCLLNRNLVGEQQGYKLCFSKLREIEQPVWLMNEHIPQVFQFSTAELDYLESRYDEREKLLRQLFPWDSSNYGVDERWAEFYPYVINTWQDAQSNAEFRLTNHSPVVRTYEVSVTNPAQKLTVLPAKQRISIQPGEVGRLNFKIAAGKSSGIYPITASVNSEGLNFEQWAEAIVVIAP